MMKALRLEADWEPRPTLSATPGPVDVSARRALRGTDALRNPRPVLVDVPHPQVHGDEVLIRVRACGICGSDLHFYERDAEGYMRYPGLVSAGVVSGHELSGVVEAVGPLVTEFDVGDPVTSEEMAWCGECLACRAGRPNNCTRIEELGFTFDGAHAELVRTRQRYCWLLRPLADAGIEERRVFELGALVEPTAVAYVALFVSAGGFAPGASVGVFGAGPIGLAAVALARAAGAGRVTAFEPWAERRELALAMGADAAMEPEAALDAAAGGMELWFEASGAAGVIEQMAATVAPAGKIVLVGRGPHRVDLDPEHLIVRGASMHGSIGHSGSRAFGRVIDLMAAGRLDMDRIVSRRVDLRVALEFLDGTRREAGKVLVLPNG